MDDLDLLLELEARDLELFKEIIQINHERDLVMTQLDRDEPQLVKLAEANTPEALRRLEKYFEELLN